MYGYFSIKRVLKNLSIKDKKNFTIGKKQFNTLSLSFSCMYVYHCIVQYNPLQNNLYIFPCRRVIFVICNEQNNVRQFRNKRNFKD